MFALGLVSWLSLLLVLLACVALGALLWRMRGRDSEQIVTLIESRLEEGQRMLAEKDARLGALNAELSQSLATSEQDHRRLAERVAENDALIEKLRQGLTHDQTLQTQLQQREHKINLLHGDMDRLRADYAMEVAQLRQRLGNADALRTQLTRYQQQLHSMDARLALVQRDKDQAIAECATRIAELEGVAVDTPAAATPAPAADISAPASVAAEPPGSVRELERDLARLRQRVLQLEGLHAVIQDRDRQIAHLRQQQTESEA